MSFFFDDVDNSAKAKRQKTIPLNTAKQLGCTVCPLKRGGAYNPDMPAWGAKEPTVYFLGEAPGELEDKQNRPFIGPSGALLKENIPDQFLRDYRLNNTVRSRPPANRAPTELELACCRASIVKDIHESKPKVIVAIGNTALQWLFADENDKGDLTKMLELAKWRGRFFPVNIEGYVCWGYCIYHPSYILRNRKTGKDGQVYKGNFDYLFEADMKNLFASVNMPPAPAVDPKHYLSGIVTTEGLRSDRELTKVLNWLEKAKQFKKVALDYETTAIRPFKPGEKILTVSIGTFDWSCAFPLDYPNAWSTTQKEKLDTAFRQFLEYPNIKIAHNAKFELEWSSFFYGKDLPKIMKFEDTQAMAYTLDERKGTHNLDILVRTYFGFWLKKLSNLDRSRMASYSLAKILPYNALDTKWTFALYEQQQELLHNDKKLLSVYQRLLPCMQMLSALQLRGVVYNEKVLNQLMEAHKKALTQIQQNIWKLPEAKQYKQQFNEPFNIGSPTATISMYRDVLGREKDITTESGKLSTDESMLGKLIDPLSKMILEWRGHSKVISTYLEPLPGYVMPDGRIHTNYNLYETSTGRLSSDSPNLQNFPSKTGKEPRGIIKAPNDHILICCDYGQIEARLIGAASQDPVFCKALWENYDVHMEWAKKIAEIYPGVVGGERFLEDKKAMKKFRSAVKNLWVFPAFYGASYISIAAGLKIPQDLAKELFDEFWEQFAGVRKWQRWLGNRYNELGYAESLFGRRRHAPLTHNAVINSPIQSTASDICVLSMVDLNSMGMDVVLNVHDEIGVYVHENDLDETMDKMVRVMTKPRLSWLNIPIAVEVKIGYDWFNMEDVKTVDSTEFYKVPQGLIDFRTIYDM